MEAFEKYPELEKYLELLCGTRRDEILSDMTKTDEWYIKLCADRADASMALMKALESSGKGILLEKYSDAIYAQAVYELDVLYKQAVYDTLRALCDKGIL